MKIAIIGCGNMGSALAKRLSETHQLLLYDTNREKASHLEEQGYGRACHDVADALDASMLILAVKPQSLGSVQNAVQENTLIVSLLAGIPIATLERYFPTAHIARMMPNLALIHGEAVVGLSANEHLKSLISTTFDVLGKVHWIAEERMDALTALTGSGPAFFFAMVEAMIEAGIAMGFTANEAQELVYQMLRGSLTLLEQTERRPAELLQQIASPQGTTIAGLKKLEESAVRSHIVSTFLAAFERGRELSVLQHCSIIPT